MVLPIRSSSVMGEQTIIKSWKSLDTDYMNAMMLNGPNSTTKYGCREDQMANRLASAYTYQINR